MFNRMTSTKFIAPRRQACKEKYFPIFSELGVLCAFAARPVEYRLDQDRVIRPKHYSTGRVVANPIPNRKFKGKFQICLVRPIPASMSYFRLYCEKCGAPDKPRPLESSPEGDRRVAVRLPSSRAEAEGTSRRSRRGSDLLLGKVNRGGW